MLFRNVRGKLPTLEEKPDITQMEIDCDGIQSSSDVYPESAEVRKTLQTCAARLATALGALSDNNYDANAVAEPITDVMSELEPLLFSLGFELDFGEFFDDDAQVGWKPTKRSRPVEPAIPDC